jgi:radical SAM superfamily enzyme YgiQ (UPF0313 family)
MNKKNILFVMPDEKKVYRDVHFKVGTLHHLPSLALAILGAIAKRASFNPAILDLTLYSVHEKALSDKLGEFKPAYVGITCTTATYFQAIEIAHEVKDKSPEVKVLVGGPHVSSTAEETLMNKDFDYLFLGEAEESFEKFLKGSDRKKIEGLAFRNEDGSLHIFPRSSFITDLDSFLYPDYSLYDLSRYKLSRLHTKRNPVVWLETSRGCPFNCMICNKVVHGQNFRPKSPERVLDEMEHFVKHGIRAFFIADDGFTSHMGRAESICDGIIKRKLDIAWDCYNGIRVDRVNRKLLKKMKRAGCHRVSFGIESGNQEILNKSGKKITLKQVTRAIKMAKAAGLEVFGFFIFGFEDETEETMKETIRFAKTLPLDLAKVSAIMPFPGSPLYARYRQMDLIYPHGDYRNFNIHTSPKHVYRHPTLKGDMIEKYENKFYRSFYLNPAYIARRFINCVKNGTLLQTIRAAASIDWFVRN